MSSRYTVTTSSTCSSSETQGTKHRLVGEILKIEKELFHEIAGDQEMCLEAVSESGRGGRATRKFHLLARGNLIHQHLVLRKESRTGSK